MDTAATALTNTQLEALRTRAAHEAGSLVDPRTLNRVQSWWRPELCEWAATIVGEPVSGLRALSWRTVVLLDLAHEAEPSPPPPPELTARRAAEQVADEQQARAEQAARAADLTSWDMLRAALPTPLSVAFNYSRHTYELHQNGGYHIVTWQDLHIGRLRRAAGDSLCETPSRRRGLHLDNKHFERQAQDEGREHPLPTCKACLRIARRLAGQTADGQQPQ